MWERKEIKRRGKRHFLRNWAAMVAVCFLLAFTGAEFAGSADFISDFDPAAMLPEDEVAIQAVNLSNWELLLEWLHIDPMDGVHPMWATATQNLAPVFNAVTAPFTAFFAVLERSAFGGWTDIALAAVGIAGGLWFSIWVLGVLSVGARRYFLESRVRDNISISAMFSVFGRGRWWNVTRGAFLKSLYLTLWAFTLVGFPIKFYAYRMVPFILAENPDTPASEAILLSRRMMKGQKWRCFVLDATFFLHWTYIPILVAAIGSTAIGLATGKLALCQSIATVLTGLLSLLFVNGYKSATYAQLYLALRQSVKDAGDPLAAYLNVDEFAGEAPSGEKPRLPDADVTLPADPIFHFAQQHKINYLRHYSIRTLILLFFTFSIVGWMWEVMLHIVSKGMLVNRGTMLGPWLPIYGAGGALVLFLLRRLFRRPVATFLVSMVLCSIIEYFTSWYLEMTKGIRWWDYSGYFMNLNGRICLEGAVTFGLACCLVVYFAGPLIASLIDRIPPATQNVLCVVLLGLFAADMVYSHFHPNQGAGITDYNDWQNVDEGTEAAGFSASTPPTHG